LRGFFSLDGPFYKYGNMLADIMILSVLWWILALPLLFAFTLGFEYTIFLILCVPLGIPAGAGTTAMFYVTTRRVTDRDGYLFRDFFRSFKNNFKQATLVWIILSAIGFILYLNITEMANLGISPTFQMFLYPFQLVFLIELVLNTLYIFVIIARFDMKFKDIFKTTVYMVHRHLLTTIMLVILLIGVMLAGDMYPLFYVIAPGCYAYVTAYLFIKIFKKYRPEIDEDPYVEIDKQHEEKLKLDRELARIPNRELDKIPVWADRGIPAAEEPGEQSENKNN